MLLDRLPTLTKVFRWPCTDRRKTATAIFLTLIMLALALSMLARRLKREEPDPARTLPSSAPGISALGRLEPQGEIIEVSAPALLEGAKVEKLLVGQGERVKTGQVIAILDNNKRLRRALELAIRNWDVARIKLAQVKAGAKAGEIVAQTSRIGQLQRELDGQVASQRLSIKKLDYEMKNAQMECKRYSSLFSSGAVSASQRDNICLLADTTYQQRMEGQAQLQRTRLTLTQQINQARASLAAIAEVRPIDVAVANAEVEAALANVKQAEANFALSLVRSPRNGQILKVITKAGEKVGNGGIVELGNTDQMTVVSEVYETDVHRVKVGQRASINGQGLAGQLTGVVNEVGLKVGKKDMLGTDPAAASDARVVEVKIKLSPQSSSQARTLTNMQVDVIIHLPEPHSSKGRHKADERP